MLDGLARSRRAWGRFDVTIEGRHPLLSVVAGAMNIRSRLTGIATGDQAMFMTRAAFAAAGGFPEIALMEDVALSARLKALSRPLCLREHVVTSGRRWESRGVFSTIALMWRLRLAYYFGAEPAALAKHTVMSPASAEPVAHGHPGQGAGTRFRQDASCARARPRGGGPDCRRG